MSEETTIYVQREFSHFPNDWHIKILKEVVSQKITYGIVQPGKHDAHGIPLIRGVDYMSGWKNMESFFKVTPELHQKYKRSVTRRGDVLLSIAGYAGEVAVVPNWIPEANITQTTARISVDESVADPIYVSHFLKSNDGRLQSRRYTKGSAQEGLNLEDVEKFLLALPPLAEQQKIASILTSVDEVIEKTESQISKLQDLKKGMMQELLTKGIGHTQFKDSPVGRVPVGWDLSKCSNLCSRIFVGIASSTTHAYSDQTGVVILRNQNILDNKIDQSDLLYINKEFSEENASKKLKKGDVISARTGYPGISAVISSEFENCHTFTTLISRPNHQTILPEFYCRFLNSSKGKNQINKLQAGGAQQNLNVEMMKEILIPLPPLEEQKKIADILTSIDDSIQQEEKELEQTQNLKKSLMQDLLTGKVRVKVD